MVAFLADIDEGCDVCADKGKACGSCYDGVRKWLDSPVKTEAAYPDWAKPGNWVYNKELNEYVQIGSMTGSEVSFMNGTYGAVSKETFLQDSVEATYRPYNHDELMNLVGEKLELPDAICLVTAANKDLSYIIVDNVAYTANELLESKYKYKGNKCGVLVHKDGDEWVLKTRLEALHRAKAVIIATGTFLAGKVFIGDVSYDSGPDGMFPSVELAKALKGNVEATFTKKVAGGFTIGPKDGGYFISFTDETFNALISEYLRPATKKLLFG